MNEGGSEPPVSYLSEGRVTQLALGLLDFDTTNPPGDTSEAVGWIESFFGELGVETDRHVADSSKPNLLATLDGKTDTTLIYNGHVDTVPINNEEWTKDPFGERVGDRIYGRGANDMKGTVASMLHTAEAFVESDTKPPIDIEFVFVSDEEVAGDAGLPSVLDARVIEGDGCVIGETTCEKGIHSVTIGDKGSIWLTLEASGESAHGSRPVLGENAVDTLYEAVSSVRENLEKRRLSLGSDVEDVIQESVEYYEGSMSEEEAERLFSYPTVNLGVFEGGESVNTVPASARAEIDIRLTPSVHTPDILSDIRKLIDKHDGVSVVDVSWSKGTYERLDSPLVESVASVAQEVTQERVYRRSATGGGDAKNLRGYGIPTVEFGLGTDTSHSADEYTKLEALVGNAEIYTRIPYVFADCLTES